MRLARILCFLIILFNGYPLQLIKIVSWNVAAGDIKMYSVKGAGLSSSDQLKLGLVLDF